MQRIVEISINEKPLKILVVLGDKTSKSVQDFAAHNLGIDDLIVVVETTGGKCQGLNLGLDLLGECDFVHMIDDDVHLPSNYFHEINRYLENNPKVGGVSPHIAMDGDESQEVPLENHNLVHMGSIHSSGNNIGFPRNIINTGEYPTSWVAGTCNAFRKVAIGEIRFPVALEEKKDKSIAGYALAEDVIFSLQISKNWPLRYLSNVVVRHPAGSTILLASSLTFTRTRARFKSLIHKNRLAETNIREIIFREFTFLRQNEKNFALCLMHLVYFYWIFQTWDIFNRKSRMIKSFSGQEGSK